MEKRAVRYMWLDTLRGLATVFVLLGHQIPFARAFFLFTSPVKIPLFFCISGFVFNDEKGNVVSFYRKMLFRIILPWLIMAFIPRICVSFVRGPAYLLESAKEILWGDMTWYFPCCIISLSICFFQCKLIKDQKWRIFSSLALSGLGFLLAYEHILDFLFINTAMITQAFLLIGREMKRHWALLGKCPVRIILPLFAVYVILGIASQFLFPGQIMDIHTNRYYNLFFCLGMIVVGNLFLFTAAPRIAIKWTPLVFVGQNSMLFYIWGGYMAGFAKQFLQITHIPHSNPIIYEVLVTLLACVGCGAVAFIINRYLPFVNGKRR